jgi:hypothetical protein
LEGLKVRDAEQPDGSRCDHWIGGVNSFWS